MTRTPPHRTFSSFTINIFFVLLIIIGIAMIPFLSLKLTPSRTLHSLTVFYSWNQASGQVLEREVTAKLEGVFSTLEGVREISSTTNKGMGRISIGFDKYVDLDAARFEVSSLIRQVYPRLPHGVTYPVIHMNRPDEGDQAILSYTVNGKVASYLIHKYVENNIKSRISQIKGIYRMEIYGATPNEWEILYHKSTLNNLNITTEDIRKAIQDYLVEKELGKGEEMYPGSDHRLKQTYLILKGHPEDTVRWDRIPVKKAGERMVYLGNLATVHFKEQTPAQFYRINGLNTVNLVIYAEKNVNTLR